MQICRLGHQVRLKGVLKGVLKGILEEIQQISPETSLKGSEIQTEPRRIRLIGEGVEHNHDVVNAD